MAAEKQFETKVKKWLETKGIYAIGKESNKMPVKPIGWYFKVWGGGFQKAGIPDLIASVRGQTVAIELKAQDGHPSDLQIHNVKQMRDSGTDACFLYPSGFEEFKHDLTLIDRVKLKEEYK